MPDYVISYSLYYPQTLQTNKILIQGVESREKAKLEALARLSTQVMQPNIKIYYSKEISTELIKKVIGESQCL